MDETQIETGPEVKPFDPYPKPADIEDISNAVLMGEELILRRWTPEQESSGGIILTPATKEVRAVAWVEKVGEDVPPGLFDVGDTVIYPMYAFQELPELGLGEEKFVKFGHIAAKDIILRYAVKGA